jgi:hypothetical protein
MYWCALYDLSVNALQPRKVKSYSERREARTGKRGSGGRNGGRHVPTRAMNSRLFIVGLFPVLSNGRLT